MENRAGYRIAAVKEPEIRARRIAEFVAMLERARRFTAESR